MSNSNPYEDFSRNPGWPGQQSPDSGQSGYEQPIPPTEYVPPGAGQGIPPTQYASPEAYPPPPQYQPPYQQSGYVPPAPSYPPSSPYQQSYQQGYVAPAPYPAYAAPANPAEPGAGLALAGLIIGIISIATSWFPICGLPLPIVGIVLSALGRRSLSRRTMATIGLILSIIAIVIGLLITIASLASSRYRY